MSQGNLGEASQSATSRTQSDRSANDRDPVIVEHRGEIVIITLNRPEKRNAINGAVTAILRSVLDEFEADDQQRIAVLTGAGGFFCAGADLRAGFKGEKIMDEHGLGSLTGRVRSKPVISAVEGPAYAGGFEIALSTDMLVAGRTASFCLPEVKRGVMAGLGVYKLQDQLPHATARYLALTGEAISAERAYELGLVSELVDAGGALSMAIELAQKINQNPAPSTRETFALLQSTVSLDEVEADRLARQGLKRLSKNPEFGSGAGRFRGDD
jgi:enoyl-CoA hydratase/carnithine racemase